MDILNKNLPTLTYVELIYIIMIPILLYGCYIVIKNLIYLVKMNIEYRKLRKTTLNNHCKDIHSWFNLYIPQNKEESRVCKDCGYISGDKGHVSMEYIKTILLQRETEEEYSDWKMIQLDMLSKTYGVSKSDLDKLSNSILGFKRDFVVHSINKMQKAHNEKNKK